MPPPPDPVAKNETSSQTYCLCFLLLPSDLKCERNVAYELSGCSGIKSDLLKRKAEVEEKLKKPLGSHCVITMFHNADSTYLSPFEPMAFSDSLWYLRLREKIHADAQMALEQKSAAAHPKVPEQKSPDTPSLASPAPHISASAVAGLRNVAYWLACVYIMWFSVCCFPCWRPVK